MNTLFKLGLQNQVGTRTIQTLRKDTLTTIRHL